MKMHILLPVCLAALVSPVLAETTTDLAEKMDTFGDAYKSFRREKDPVKGAETTREAQQLILKTLSLTPELVSKMPDGPEKVKAAAAYRKMMGEVFVTLCKIEEAYLASDLDAVVELYGSLKELRKAGHDKFMEE